MFQLTNNLIRRTVYVRLSGKVSLDDIRRLDSEYRGAVDSYRGKAHFVVADMRGLAPLPEEPARIMSEAIAYGRSHGVVLCAHLADSAITRMQAARLARQAAPGQPGTFDVTSPEEAEKLLDERRAELRAAVAR